MRIAIFLMFVSGCAATGPARPYPINVRGLAPPQRTQRIEPGVAVIADAVTRSNWLEDHRDLLKHLTWSESTGAAGGHEGASMAGPGGGMGAGFNTAAVAGQEMRYDDLPMVPLPSFRVELQNETTDPITFDKVSFDLDDGHGHVYHSIESIDEIVDAVVDDVTARHPELLSAIHRTDVDNLRESVRKVQIWNKQSTLKGGEMKAAYVSFRMTTRDAGEFARIAGSLKELTLRINGLATTSGPLEPVAFSYTVPKRPTMVQCPDGSRAPHWRMCKKMAELPYQPVADGPCIQETKVKYTLATTQWWAGVTPVANSDVWRMLLAERSTHAEIKKGMAMRWAGYMLVGASLLSTVLATATLATSNTYHGTSIPYYGLTPLAVLPVGIGLVGGAVKHTDRAIENYNTEVEDTGACAPVW
jgi:hypothetical protein